MVFRLIDKNTMMNLQFLDKLSNTTVSHKGFLHEPVRDIVLRLSGDALYDYCRSLPQAYPLFAAFHRGEKEFSFDARFDGIMVAGNTKLTEITAMGVIHENHRRATRRFAMTLDAALYSTKESDGEHALYNGQTYDISCDSVSIWTNDTIKDEKSPYYVKFTLFNKDSFNIPVRLLKKKSAPTTSYFRHDYVFLFDFETDVSEKNRLLDAFIMNSLEAMRAQKEYR